MRLLICAGGTGGGVYPALAVLDRLTAENPGVQVLWVGGESGMEAELVSQSGLAFRSIPAAGLHGVGLRRLPGNIIQLLRGTFAARSVLNRFKPDVMFFTGGYVGVPMAFAGMRIPSVLFVPDIEPGLALRLLSFFADQVAVIVEESKAYFSTKKDVVITGYPVRPVLSAWQKDESYRVFGFTPELPTLLVTGGSLGSLSINKALVQILPALLSEMQIIHLTGKLTWPQFENIRGSLPPEHAARFSAFPFLHREMGAALRVADLVVSRAGASSIGEYPHFGLPAILVPYPHAWQYQQVNAEYLVRHGAAVLLKDEELASGLLPLVRELVRDPERLSKMSRAMYGLANHDAARSIAKVISEIAAS